MFHTASLIASLIVLLVITAIEPVAATFGKLPRNQLHGVPTKPGQQKATGGNKQMLPAPTTDVTTMQKSTVQKGKGKFLQKATTALVSRWAFGILWDVATHCSRVNERRVRYLSTERDEILDALEDAYDSHPLRWFLTGAAFAVVCPSALLIIGLVIWICWRMDGWMNTRMDQWTAEMQRKSSLQDKMYRKIYARKLLQRKKAL